MTLLAEMRAQHQQLRRDIHEDFAGYRREMRSDMQALEERLNGRFARVDTRLGELDAKIGDVKSDLMKWSFVFWCGAVAAVAALAGVLRP